MRLNIKKLFFLACNRYRNTPTAQDVVTKLKKQGITQEEIRGDHLSFIYNNLRCLTDAPDFSFPSKSLSGLGVREQGDSQAPLWGVIVETRQHPALAFVVDNFNKKVGAPIQLFHGVDNHDFILSTPIADLVSKGLVILTALNTEQLTAAQYNALFLSKKFWNMVLGREKILVFQTDAIACERSDFTIDEFMSFDYIGSKWPLRRPVGINIEGGNGGLSLRDWGETITCLERFPPEQWAGGEDGYFAFHLDVMGAKVGRSSECAKFSTQHEFLFNSFGAHKISSLNEASRGAFLEYCPEVKSLG